jgi:hypothetical protein
MSRSQVLVNEARRHGPERGPIHTRRELRRQNGAKLGHGALRPGKDVLEERIVRRGHGEYSFADPSGLAARWLRAKSTFGCARADLG